jgi:hypothetical protein
MPVITVRPDGTLSEGVWAKVGPPGITMHQCLNDDSDLTYVEVNRRVQTDDEIAKLSIQDFDLPDRAKIFAVRSRVRVQKIQATPEDPNPPTPQPGCGFHRGGLLGFLIFVIFVLIFHFRCPRKPPKPNPTDPPDPPEWTTIELGYYPEQPGLNGSGGGEWTEDSFNDFFVSLSRADSDNVVLRISGVWVDLDYNEAPVVTPNGPVGPLVDITLPTVTWQYEDPESDKQAEFWVRIFTSDVYTDPNFNPAESLAFDESVDGWIKGEDTFWSANRDHPNGTYRAYVKTRQVWAGIGVHESDWGFWQWVQDVPGPPEPVLTATVELDLNRVRLDLHEGGPSPQTDTYNLEFSDNLGAKWDLLRDGRRVDIDAERDSLLYDYSAPANKKRIYRGAAFRVLNSIWVTSGFSNIAEAIPTIDRFWLKDLLVPTSNMPLWVIDMTRERPRSQGKWYPLVADENGQGLAIVKNGVQFGEEGVLSLGFFRDKVTGEEESWNQFQTINNPGRTLLLQSPNNEQWDIGLGKITYSGWRIRNNETPYRLITIPYTQTYAPPDLTTGVKR